MEVFRSISGLENVQVVRLCCANCGARCLGHISADGFVRLSCGRCKVIMVSKKRTTRIIDVRVTMPFSKNAVC